MGFGASLDVPIALDELIRALIQSDPSQRIQDTTVVLEELERVRTNLEAHPVEAESELAAPQEPAVFRIGDVIDDH